MCRCQVVLALHAGLSGRCGEILIHPLFLLLLPKTELAITNLYSTFVPLPLFPTFLGAPPPSAQYKQRCTGAMAETDDCVQVARTIELLKEELQVFGHLPAVFYIQGAYVLWSPIRHATRKGGGLLRSAR